MQNILFTAEIVTPVFLIIALGFILKKFRIISDNFVTVTSKFVFNVSLPALIFFNISKIDLSTTLNVKEIIFICTAIISTYLIIWIVSKYFIKEGKNLGVFIQGSYRGNFAIVGFAVIDSLYGNIALGKASLILAFILPLYNILAVIALTVPLSSEKEINYKSTFIEILTNPLVLAVIFALPFSYYKIVIPSVIIESGDYLSAIALPLALIGIGCNLNLTEIKKASTLAFASSTIKLILLPLVVTFLAYEFGFIGQNLGMIFILFACPTAIVSFIMADAMGGNSKLAGNIVVITTLGSIVTITIGLFLLKEFGLI